MLDSLSTILYSNAVVTNESLPGPNSLLAGQQSKSQEDCKPSSSRLFVSGQNEGNPNYSRASGSVTGLTGDASDGKRTADLAPSDLTTSPRTRECDCPEWVERCAHFGGKWLALHLAPLGQCWAVCWGLEPPTYIPYGVPGHVDHVGVLEFDEAAALAAFHDAEARLLNGELA